MDYVSSGRTDQRSLDNPLLPMYKRRIDYFEYLNIWRIYSAAPSTVTLSQFCHKRRQAAKRLYLWTRQNTYAIFICKNCSCGTTLETYNIRAILVMKKYVIFTYRKNRFAKVSNNFPRYRFDNNFV